MRIRSGLAASAVCASMLLSQRTLAAQSLSSPEPTATASAEAVPLPPGTRVLTVPGGTVVIVALTDKISSGTAKVGDTFGLIYAFTADGFTHRELRDYVERARSRLLREPDVSKVEIFGAQD